MDRDPIGAVSGTLMVNAFPAAAHAPAAVYLPGTSWMITLLLVSSTRTSAALPHSASGVSSQFTVTLESVAW